MMQNLKQEMTWEKLTLSSGWILKGRLQWGEHLHGYSQEAFEWRDSPDYTQDDGDNLSQPVNDIQELIL